jgi:hypothetical protein
MGLCLTVPPILQFGRQLMVFQTNIQRSPRRNNTARHFMSVVSVSEAALVLPTLMNAAGVRHHSLTSWV